MPSQTNLPVLINQEST